MTNPAAPSVANAVSQDPVGASGGVLTVPVDIGAMPIGPRTGENETIRASGIFSPQAADRGEGPSSVETMPAVDVAQPVVLAETAPTTEVTVPPPSCCP